jgi:hypothetical protein
MFVAAQVDNIAVQHRGERPPAGEDYTFISARGQTGWVTVAEARRRQLALGLLVACVLAGVGLGVWERSLRRKPEEAEQS